MGEKVMQSHSNEDGERWCDLIYKKDAQELSLRGFCLNKKSGQQNKEYVGVFALTLRCILYMLDCESLES